jgi:uncharacterized protein YndB with AHSA1/START domain
VAAENSVDTAEDPRAIIATRILDAPRALVFEAWTDPKHLVQWWGPIGFTTTTRAIELRPGGVWRFVMHGPDGRDYENRITFDEIVTPERLVYQHGGGEDVEAVRFNVTVTFDDLDGKTRLTMRMVFPSQAERDRVIKDYHGDTGLSETLGRLIAHVATMGAASSEAGRELVLTRVLDAPRSLVFEVWTDPKHMAQWWGPHGFTNPVCEVDVRPGGAIRILMRAPSGVDHLMTGTFREIAPPERLVFTAIAMDEDGNFALETLTTVSFAERDGKTTLTVHARVIRATEKAVRMLAGMDAGWSQSLERLEALVDRQHQRGGSATT